MDVMEPTSSLAGRSLGWGAAGLLAAQGLASVVIPPSVGNSYSGTRGDVLNNSLFAAALVALAAFLLASDGVLWERRGRAAAALGCLLLATSTVVTIAAGEERWDGAFVSGFALAIVGWMVALVAGRALGYPAMMLGLVLSLAFFDSAGSAALAAAVLLCALRVGEGRGSRQY